MYKLNILIWCLISSMNLINCDELKEKQQQEIWEKDLTDSFKIEGSDQGIQKVNLKCGAESMLVQLQTEKDFTGVMYTRGSFYKQTQPCFMKPTTQRGARSLEMKFNFDQCQTQQDGDVYSNIVVIQNDPELITPGDSAFSLECDFRKSREHQVNSEYQARDRNGIYSKITFISPDPSDTINLQTNDSIQSYTDSVTYIPKDKRNKDISENRIEKDEL